MQSETAEKPLGVLLPTPLHQCLEDRAIDNRRTLNAEILVCIEESLKRQEEAAESKRKRPRTTLDTLLDDARTASINVSASVGLLGDLLGEVGIARRDSDIGRLARALDVIRQEAEKIEEILNEASNRSCTSTPAEVPSTSTASRLRRRASDPQ